MLKNNKGQALVEFIVILPVFIMIIFCLVDFGRIFYVKSDLESTMSDVISMYHSKHNYEEIRKFIKNNNGDIDLTITNDNETDLVFDLNQKIEIFTPVLNLILGNPYEVSIKRVVLYE